MNFKDKADNTRTCTELMNGIVKIFVAHKFCVVLDGVSLNEDDYLMRLSFTSCDDIDDFISNNEECMIELGTFLQGYENYFSDYEFVVNEIHNKFYINFIR